MEPCSRHSETDAAARLLYQDINNHLVAYLEGRKH
jgi:hypothetical protein